MSAPALAPGRGRASFAARFGHQVSAGHDAPPGALARLPAWWGPTHWVDVEVRTAVYAHRDLARAEHVDPDTAVRVARAHARYADRCTGRACRPTNERLAADLQMSVRQIQRARSLLKRLKLMTELVRGRSIMSRAERLTAWRNGSSHRHIAAEFALTSLRGARRRPKPVERVTPPPDSEGERVSSDPAGFLRAERPRMSDAPRRAQPQGRPRPPARPETLTDAQTRRLAVALQGELTWLRGVSPRRLSILRRFARQRWTEGDVRTAITDTLRARGWTVPARVDHPPAYLAALLRDVDPNDRPGAVAEAQLAEERTRRDWIWRVNFGNAPECPHGTPLGNVPHPITGVRSCPFCRRAS